MKNANPVCERARWWVALGLLVAIALTAGCKDDAPPAAPKTVDDFFTITLGGVPAKLQLAVHMAEMQRGLMERTNLGADEGMLFLYARPQQMSFWMHDTPTPLDIGFFDADGVLREVHAMQPFDETTVRSSSQQLQFAVEMNQGWFARHEVKPGAQIDRAALAAALRARNVDPRKFGLHE